MILVQKNIKIFNFVADAIVGMTTENLNAMTTNRDIARKTEIENETVTVPITKIVIIQQKNPTMKSHYPRVHHLSHNHTPTAKMNVQNPPYKKPKH